MTAYLTKISIKQKKNIHKNNTPIFFRFVLIFFALKTSLYITQDTIFLTLNSISLVIDIVSSACEVLTIFSNQIRSTYTIDL